MARRPLWMVVVLLLGGGAALWGAGEIRWYPAPADGGVLGGTGTEGPGFTAVAWLALAALAGVFAVSGWPRRLLGATVVAAGGWVGWRAFDTDGAFDLLSGRGLALLGGVLLVAGGLVIVFHATELPTMGTRYERAATERRSGDPDRDLWDGLSGGEDPTLGEPRT